MRPHAHFCRPSHTCSIPCSQSDFALSSLLSTCSVFAGLVTYVRLLNCYVRPLKSTGYIIGILIQIKKQFLILVLPSKWHKLHFIVTNYARSLKAFVLLYYSK